MVDRMSEDADDDDVERFLRPCCSRGRSALGGSYWR